MVFIIRQPGGGSLVYGPGDCIKGVHEQGLCVWLEEDCRQLQHNNKKALIKTKGERKGRQTAKCQNTSPVRHFSYSFMVVITTVSAMSGQALEPAATIEKDYCHKEKLPRGGSLL